MRTDSAPCYALVPIKRRALCKSRLALVMGERQRRVLVRLMLQRVLAALAEARSIGPVAVVSAERDTVPPDIEVLADAGAGLNAALESAQRVLLAHGARHILVLPADLPQVCAQDIDALVHAGRSGGFALASDAAGTGTNALFWSVPSPAASLRAAQPLRFQFGPGSCQRHQAQARRLGVAPALVHRPGLAFDVDTAQDLAQLMELAPYRQQLQLGEREVGAPRRVQHA